MKLSHALLLCDDPNCIDVTHLSAIDEMYNLIISALRMSSEELVQEKTNGKHQPIAGWNEYCQEAHHQAREAFLMWCRNSKPRSGFLLTNMQRTRATFKQALRHCRASESRTQADSLARKLLLKDKKQFWSEIKKLNGKTSAPLASTVGPATGAKGIAEMWKQHFMSLLNSTPPGTKKDTVVTLLDRCSELEAPITPLEVHLSIKQLKSGKSCGLDYLQSEHFKNACDKLSILLCLCFNSMILHGYVTKGFSDTILIPIIKDK